MGEHFRLPDNSITSDVNVYAMAWRAIASPIEELMGWRCFAFDPGLLFHTVEGGSASVRVDLAEAIRRLRLVLPPDIREALAVLHEEAGVMLEMDVCDPSDRDRLSHARQVAGRYFGLGQPMRPELRHERPGEPHGEACPKSLHVLG